MFVDERIKALDCKGRDFPILRGDVKLTLKNIYNGKTETVESHNVITDALSDIFGGNYGGLVNYQNFADLYKTYLGGVLLFRDQLDLTTPEAYGIPSESVNPCVAHAGQEPLTSQQDDYKRGNPDDTGTLVLENSTKLTFVWSPSAGNAPKINSLALTHSDVGSYGCGVVSQAQKSLVPFADVGCLSRSFEYGDNSTAVLAIDETTETAYNFYLADSTTVHIYKTPINLAKYKLQGGALLPLTAYTQPTITATLPTISPPDAPYNREGAGDCYYWFDFANNKLVLFCVPVVLGETLYRDDIDLTTGAVTHSKITVTGAKLYKFKCKEEKWYPTVDGTTMSVPTQALIHDGYLYVYGCSDSTHKVVADTMYKINLANTGDVSEVDTADMGVFTADDYYASWSKTLARHTTLGGLLVQDNFIINGDKVYQTATHTGYRTVNYNYSMPNKISSPVCGVNASMNAVSICKLYLATKYNLPSEIQKTASQSMTVEYTLTEI